MKTSQRSKGNKRLLAIGIGALVGLGVYFALIQGHITLFPGDITAQSGDSKIIATGLDGNQTLVGLISIVAMALTAWVANNWLTKKKR